MSTFTTPLIELNRMEELYALQLSDASVGPDFDNLAQLASEICNAPVALISFVHQDHISFKSRVGFDDAQALQAQSFCRHVIEDVNLMIVEDAAADPRFQNDEFVLAAQGIRFFAGVPLMLASGLAVGSLCVIDHKARTLSDRQSNSLKRLADQVVALIEARRAQLRLLTQEKNRLVSEQRLDFALAAADIGDWDMDLRTNVVRRSLKHDQCFGYTEPVPVWGYDIFLAHVLDADRDRVDQCYQRAMAGEGAFDVEFRVVWPNQTLHWLWSKGCFYFDDKGKPYRVAGIQVDITTRKKFEEDMRESEHRWRFAIEGSGDGLWDWDIQNNRVFYSERWMDILGLENDDIEGTPLLWAAHLHPQDKDRVLAEVQAHLDGQTSHFTSEYRVLCKGGGQKWVLGRGLVIQRDAIGKPLRMIGTSSDITERKQVESALQVSNAQLERDITQRKLAEFALHESEAQHRNMFANNPQPMWLYDTETLAFLSVNDATVTQYGYTREELQQMTLRDIHPIEDLAKLKAHLAIARESRAATAQVLTHLRKHRGRIQVEVSAHAMEFQGRSARLVLANDITERLQSEARLHLLAFHDVLTGLPNRLQFLNSANELLQKNETGSHLNACILLDLDNFKSINDHWGPASGDELLKQVSRRVRECLPQSSFFARLGGDEFIALVTDIGPDQACASMVAQDVCSKILMALARGFLIDNREQFTSASLGIALFGDVALTVNELLSRADSAMYLAKADGRNAFRFFDEQMQAQLAAQSEMEGDLRQCIHKDELHLVYQPQVDHLGNIVGAEALLRWTHPVRGLVSPAKFICAAENTGLIVQIGQWVLRTVCMALVQWQSSEDMAGLAVAVNVSAKQFHHPDFVSQVLAELESSGANPALLKLELTESLLAQDLDGIVQKMNTLKAVGVTFSLDDFGTGYSSLAYLKRLPLDQLKIDQGFVRDVLVDSSDAAIVRTVIALGDRLGLKVIAEGVETQEQREFLEFNCCYAFQGYWFSRPLKKEDYEVFCGVHNCGNAPA